MLTCDLLPYDIGVSYRPWSILAFLLLSLSLSCNLAAGTLWNGTFEDGSLSPWVVLQGTVQIGTTAHTGKYGVAMGPGSSESVLAQPVSGLVSGQTYLVSAWVMAASPATGAAELAVGNGNTLVGSPISPSSEWQQVTQEVTVGPGETITVYLGKLPTSVSETIFWDDVLLTPVPPANPGFESAVLSPWIVSQGSPLIGTTAHSGKYGLTMPSGNTTAIVGQTIGGLVPGDAYVVSAWVEASAASTAAAELEVGGAGGILGTPVSVSTSWQQVSQTYTVGADGSITIYLSQLASGVTVYWDDVAVSAGSGAGTPIPDVLTYHNDLARTGQNTSEFALTPSNVASSTFGRLFSLPVDGYVLAQPLYLAGQFVQGSGFHNVIVAATEAESVYLFDADNNTGANANPLWHISLIDAAHGGLSQETAAPAGLCSFGPANEGVTGTPVIDPNSGVLYVEAKSSASGQVIQRLHAIDMTTGAEEPGWPITIGGSVAGTGDGSVNGQLTFNPSVQLNRPGLLLSGGLIFVAFGSNGCDSQFGAIYHGWLFGYDAATGSESLISTSPNGHADGTGEPAGASIWMSGAAPAADANGNMYLATANGAFDTSLNSSGMPSMGDYGDSILKLAPVSPLTVGDYFTPIDQSFLGNNDIDLGSGGVLLLPQQPGSFPDLLVQAGKEGAIRLINRDNMMHYCSTCQRDPVVQEIPRALPHVETGMPTYWNDLIYFGANQDYIRAYSLAGGLLSSTPVALSSDPAPNSYGTTPSVSAAGTSNGILWGIQQWPGPAGLNGVLKAWNAENLTLQYASNNEYPEDAIGGYVEFTVPTVAHGKVYVGTQTSIAVYGLLPAARSSLVNDGSFETGNLSPAWDTYIPAGGTGSITVASAAALSGSYGLVEGSNSNAEVAYQTIQGLTPDQSYVVSAWVRLGSGTPATVYLYADNTAGANTCTSPSLTPVSDWQQLSCVYVATANQSMNIHLVENPGSFTTYWDNVAVTPVPPSNGGFETGMLSPWNGYIPAGATGSMNVSVSAARSGNYGLIQGPNSASESTWQTIGGLTPGQSYLASAWVALGAGTPGTAYLSADDSTGANPCTSEVITPQAAWQPISCAYTVTTDEALSLQLVENAGQFSTYWDDAALTPLPPVNGGFETGNLGQYWLTYLPQGGTGSFGVSSLAAHSGSYGLVQGPNSAEEAVYQTITGLVPGQPYVISAWVMLGSGTGEVFLYAQDTGSSSSCGTPLVTATTQWQQISCVYTATSFQAVTVFLAQNWGPFSTYWDDVALTPVPPVNGGFESGAFTAPWTSVFFNGGTGSINVSTAAAYSGTYGLVEGPNSAGEEARQNVYGIVPGQTYVVSGWVMLASGSAGSVYLTVDDTTGANGCSTSGFTPTTIWTQISCAYTANSTQAMTIHIGANAGAFSTYWDDVQVTGSLTDNIWENFVPTSLWADFGFSYN